MSSDFERRVTGIQGYHVLPKEPLIGQVLTYNGSAWEPDDLPPTDLITLTSALENGNITDGYNIIISDGDIIDFGDGYICRTENDKIRWQQHENYIEMSTNVSDDSYITLNGINDINIIAGERITITSVSDCIMQCGEDFLIVSEQSISFSSSNNLFKFGGVKLAITTKGTDLTSSNQTLTIAGGSLYESNNLSSNCDKTLGVTSASAGIIIYINKFDTSVNVMTIKDDAGTTLFVFPANVKYAAKFRFDGTHFILWEHNPIL